MRSDRRDTPSSSSSIPRSRPDPRRRGFLLAIGAGGAASAAVAAAALAGSPPRDDTAGDSDQGKGYRVTDHVRRYYRTTKI
ncbi:MAG TPA: formate dehydrogenase [Casimicrobiaceae bacterium]|nr:formate dehydrogenase [Casimicrobiaceae bacterium]